MIHTHGNVSDYFFSSWDINYSSELQTSNCWNIFHIKCVHKFRKNIYIFSIWRKKHTRISMRHIIEMCCWMAKWKTTFTRDVCISTYINVDIIRIWGKKDKNVHYECAVDQNRNEFMKRELARAFARLITAYVKQNEIQLVVRSFMEHNSTILWMCNVYMWLLVYVCGRSISCHSTVICEFLQWTPFVLPQR